MKFYADMHIHSRFSRATSRDCDLVELARWAARKGLKVIGTGDFTHPEWFAEIQEQLQSAEPGLFRLTDAMLRHLPPEEQPLAAEVRFILQVEISTIYKKEGRTRKVHHVIYVPSQEAADRFRRALDRIGNIESDGRPILGLDSRHLLEIVLECDEAAYLVPAHIWTPWFSVLGDKSGFSSIEECYEDLTPQIFAVETGLSSDPPMNWRVSSLDRFRLVSNSDAHSPAKLGREACVFGCPLDYFAMRQALKTGEGYLGTVEFFPEEGKYHFDGHRKCNICLSPAETRRYNGLCPVCGKPLTVGVMHRVEELADRPRGARPPAASPFRSFIPLEEIIAEVEQVSSQSRRVRDTLEIMLQKFGPELFILEEAPLEEIARLSPLVAEGIRRMRHGEVIKYPGYDGNYGLIRLFRNDELRQNDSVGLLFELPEFSGETPARIREAGPRTNDRGQEVFKETLAPAPLTVPAGELADDPLLGDLDAQQLAAVTSRAHRQVVIAGPGTGKTHTLTRRIAYLIRDHGLAPDRILAVTFTRRAAEEMRQRLSSLVPQAAAAVTVTTFHGLAWKILQENQRETFGQHRVRIAAPDDISQLLCQHWGLTPRRAAAELSRLEKSRRTGRGEDAAVREYRNLLLKHGLVDYTDLILLASALLARNAGVRHRYQNRFAAVLVDEFQDIDRSQYELLRCLISPQTQLFIIGDPAQSIYGFRGADPSLFDCLFQDFPDAERISLKHNYRSTASILEGALSVITQCGSGMDLKAVGAAGEKIIIHTSPTENAEAEFVASTIERMIGGATFFSLDSGRATGAEPGDYSFGDFAVLFRTLQQARPVAEALARLGVPFRLLSHRPLSERPAVRYILQRIEQARSESARPEISSFLSALVQELRSECELEPAELDWLERMLPSFGQLASSLDELAERLLLGSESDLYDPRADAVSLLTLHAAKGLEFPVVFIVGCEDGIIPLQFGRTLQPAQADEERRLFFVGMTRARRVLYLSHASRRTWQGKLRTMTPSPFLREIREHLTERRQTSLTRRNKPGATQLVFQLHPPAEPAD